MFRRLFLIGIFVLSYSLVGCGVRPQVDFYVNPIATERGQQIDAETGVVTMEEAGVSVTVSAMDTVDLMSVTSDADINPYIYVSDWGTARSRYTVFDVAIRNNRDSEVEIDPAGSVLMDETGEQYEAIPYEALREKYYSYSGLEQDVIYYTPPPRRYRSPYYGRRSRRNRWYSDYDLYWARRPAYVRRIYSASYFKRAIISGTMLKTIKLYPGGKRQGLIVFPVLAPDANRLKLIIPGITTYTGEGGKKKAQVRFQFHFERVPALNGRNDDKKDAGAG